MGSTDIAVTDGARPRLLEVYKALDRMHAPRGWHWWPDADPFEVIVGCILVQNTMWTNVERALDRLRPAGALVPEAMSALSDAELEDLVRPSGQYRAKAKKLRALLALVEEHGSLGALLAIPPDLLRERLLATWGIGEETADAIVIYAARQPTFVVDAYTRRLFGRLGFGPHPLASYEHWRQWFQSELAEPDPEARRELWARYHALIVLHNKHLCRKHRPLCGQCGLATACPSAEAAP